VNALDTNSWPFCIIGMCCGFCRSLSNDDVTLARVGTTAEVLAVKEDVDTLSGLAATRIKAIGRQRFRVLSTTRQLGGYAGLLDSSCISIF